MFSFLMNAEDDESDFFKLSKLKNSTHSALKSAKKFVKAVFRKKYPNLLFKIAKNRADC